MPNEPAAAGNQHFTAGAVKDILSRLDGSSASVVSMLTGLSADELDELGGVPEPLHHQLPNPRLTPGKKVNMNHTKVLIKKLHPDAVVPKTATPGDAGADLRALEAGAVRARSWDAVGTGIAIELEPGTVGLVHPRSGLAAEHGITVLNAPGTIDSGYRGEVKVLLSNTSDVDFWYEAGDRIAQLVIQEYLVPAFQETDTFSDSVRGEGGFGHTGTV